MEKPAKISIVIPSAPDREFTPILENLKKIQPHGIAMEIFIIKGTWPPLQRNLAIKQASGEYIFLFDDDVIVPDGGIQQVLKTFAQNPAIQVIGGPNITPPGNSFIQHCFGFAHASYFIGLETAVRYYPAKKPPRVDENHLISCNLAFRSTVLKHHLFDPEIFPNEENELLGRILKSGNLLSYNPDFIVHHHRRKNIRAYIGQIFNWGKGRTIHSFKRIKHFKPLFFVPAFFLFYLISLIWFHPRWYCLPLIIYGLVDVLFSFNVAIEGKKWRYFGVMVWLFPLTHITYALGLLFGFTQLGTQQQKLPEEKSFQLIKIEVSSSL